MASEAATKKGIELIPFLFDTIALFVNKKQWLLKLCFRLSGLGKLPSSNLQLPFSIIFS